jgi:hypothetical protein
MVHVVARSRPQCRHETVAFININPLLCVVLHFPTVREVLEEFFEKGILVSLISNQVIWVKH